MWVLWLGGAMCGRQAPQGLVACKHMPWSCSPCSVNASHIQSTQVYCPPCPSPMCALSCYWAYVYQVETVSSGGQPLHIHSPAPPLTHTL
jgi:hypothetical protein